MICVLHHRVNSRFAAGKKKLQIKQIILLIRLKLTEFPAVNKVKLGYPVQVCIRIFWHIIIEYNVDTFYVHTTTKQIGSYENALLKVLKLLVTTQSNTRNKQT